MTGARPPARPRPLIQDSWRRLQAKGIEPDRPPTPVVEPSKMDELRHASGLVDVLDDVSRGLETLVTGSDNILVLADSHGRILWRSGPRTVLDRADRLGFVEGAHWSEESVGTNAVGTALVAQRTVQVFSAEHYSRSHHPWTCTGAPIRDPRTGRMLGVVDVSGPAATVHPATVGLVDAVARLAEAHLHLRHQRALDTLRAVAAPILARIGAPAVAVDHDGWVAAVAATPPSLRIMLTDDIAPGRAWIPALGPCDVEPLPGGWLLRVCPEDLYLPEGAVRATLDLRNPETPTLELKGHLGHWRRDLSLRHAEILLALAIHPEGRSAQELAADLYGDPTRVVTVRAEISRLRKQLVGILSTRPYRFATMVNATVHLPDDRTRLLPASSASVVRTLRGAVRDRQTPYCSFRNEDGIVQGTGSHVSRSSSMDG